MYKLISEIQNNQSQYDELLCILYNLVQSMKKIWDS